MVSKVRGHKRSRLVSELMSRRMEDEENEETAGDRFYIRSHNEGFQNRQTSVFDKLNELESKFTVNATSWKDDDDCLKHDESGDTPAPATSSTVDDKVPKPVAGPCKDEQFKIPIGVAPKRAAVARPSSVDSGSSSVPDYCANPDQWTKYSLANITAEFMSEDANTDAAMTFLTSRWKACSDYEETNGEGLPLPPRKLEFGKFLMPEYTVGRAGKKGSGKSTKTATSGKETETDDLVKLPKVQLSFLDSTAGEKNASSTSFGVDEPGCSRDAAEPQPTAPSGSEPLDVEPVFRAVRKRKRNIRQASINNDDGDYGDHGSNSKD